MVFVQILRSPRASSPRESVLGRVPVVHLSAAFVQQPQGISSWMYELKAWELGCGC